MSDKFERRIMVRGLTSSNVGSRINFGQGDQMLEGVRYSDGKTIVKVSQWVEIPNSKEISIVD